MATPLYYAAIENNIDAIKLLISKGANVVSYNGHLNAQYHYEMDISIEMYELLIDNGLNVDYDLYVAACNNNVDVATILIKKSIPLDGPLEDDHSTPLYIAAREGALDVFKLLLEHGADPLNELSEMMPIEWLDIGVPYDTMINHSIEKK